MRLVRSFSTTSLRYHQKQQPSTYVPAWNSLRVKSPWIKCPMKESNYNQKFTSDFWFWLQALRSTEEQLTARNNLRDKLQNIVQSNFGRDFEVQYVGLACYASETREEPYEFAIVDTNVEQGVVGKEYLENLSLIYDPIHVAQVLLREGFDGVTDNPAFVPVADREFPWPAYHRLPRREVLYPVRLRAHHPVAFDLILPGPTIVPLVRLLSTYGKITKGMPEMITLLFLWLKSFGMRQISPACIALLFIRFLQENCEFPCLTSSDDKWNGKRYDATPTTGNTGRWASHEHRLWSRPHESVWSKEQVLLETAFVSDPMLFNEAAGFNPAFLLDKFMESWSYGFKSIGSLVVSVNAGGRIGRTCPYVVDRPLDLELLERECSGTYDQGKQPPTWKTHPLVVQDPFVYTHNHAEFVSQRTIDDFQKQASISHKVITSGNPLISIFGPCLDLSSIQTSRMNLIRELQSSYPAEITQLPPLSVANARSDTVKRVEDVIERCFHVKYRVEVFGSTMYGLDTPTSDLDLVVIDPDRMDGFPPRVNLKRLPPVYNVRQIGRELQTAGFAEIVCIPKANVPIVKFKDPHTGIECDLNVNDQLGSINTAMIKQYLGLQPYLRPLLKMVKIWAKSLGLNSPSGGRVVSFSSYALTLMTIGFFQMNGWLPNLQDPNGLGPRTQQKFFWMKTKHGQRNRCDVSYTKMEFWPLLEARLEDTLLQWFAYWGREFQFGADLVCIRRGGIVQRKDKFVTAPELSQDKKQRTEPDFPQVPEEEEIPSKSNVFASDPKEWGQHPLVVADPFILSKNCCGQINFNTITKFVHGCQSTERLLKGGTLRDLVFNVAQKPSSVDQPLQENNRMGNKSEGSTKKRPETAPQAGQSAIGGQISEKTSTGNIKRNRFSRARRNRRKDLQPVIGGATLVDPRSSTPPQSLDRTLPPHPPQTQHFPRKTDERGYYYLSDNEEL